MTALGKNVKIKLIIGDNIDNPQSRLFISCDLKIAIANSGNTGMIKLVKPKVEVEPTKLEFRDEGARGIVLYPDGDLLVFWGLDEFYDEGKINILDRKNFDKLFAFVYKQLHGPNSMPLRSSDETQEAEK